MNEPAMQILKRRKFLKFCETAVDCESLGCSLLRLYQNLALAVVTMMKLVLAGLFSGPNQPGL